MGKGSVVCCPQGGIGTGLQEEFCFAGQGGGRGRCKALASDNVQYFHVGVDTM